MDVYSAVSDGCHKFPGIFLDHPEFFRIDLAPFMLGGLSWHRDIVISAGAEFSIIKDFIDYRTCPGSHFGIRRSDGSGIFYESVNYGMLIFYEGVIIYAYPPALFMV